MHGGTLRQEKPFSAVLGWCDVTHAADKIELAISISLRVALSGSPYGRSAANFMARCLACPRV
jgi:hypothetical protein